MSEQTTKPTFKFWVPKKLEPLLCNARYKAAHGGRGGGKSHFFANFVIAKCLVGRVRIVCIREVQRSIRESVRQLLIDKITENNLGHLFVVKQDSIEHPNGSIIIFKGMQSYNAANIKSLEGFDIAWIEEAQTLSSISWSLLRPTIRKANSEIWCSWNPTNETDAVDKYFRGDGKPSDAVVAEINWNDNPRFPEVLVREKDDDYANRPEEAEHIWGGGYVKITEGAYFARQILQMEADGRLWTGKFNPALPVHTSWDIGVRDKTAIWFWQQTIKDVTVVDFYETEGDGIEQIVRQCMPELNPDLDEAAETCLELGRYSPFDYGKHYLPHDVGNREWGSGGRSRYEILQGWGVKPVLAGIARKPATRIAAVRAVLPYTKFCESTRIAFGVKRLRDYRRRFNDILQTYTEPLHDDASHAADAFGEFAVNCPLVTLPKLPAEVFDEPEIDGQPSGRMQVKLDVRAYLQRKEREAKWAD